MKQKVLVVGGGIGGLAAALALQRAGWDVQLFERAQSFGEVGAGIQLGPNATRILQAWGLGDALQSVASSPRLLRLRDVGSDRTLAQMAMAGAMEQRYGTPYLTIHRADMHALLLQAVRDRGVACELANAIESVAEGPQMVRATDQFGVEYEAGALIGADGLWSTVRAQVVPDGLPLPTGHLAWRALLSPADLPRGVAADEVSVWLGAQMHLVCYPLRRGQVMNVVMVAEGASHGDITDWSQDADAEMLAPLIRTLHARPAAVMQAVTQWKLWALNERAPLPGSDAMARGRVALVGDASHAMRPYLAQGAVMALEDAAQLGLSLPAATTDVPGAFQAYARARWQRNARVQRQSQRNGVIFHASGALRLARDIALRAGGSRLLDSPWLYGHGPGGAAGG